MDWHKYKVRFLELLHIQGVEETTVWWRDKEQFILNDEMVSQTPNKFVIQSLQLLSGQGSIL